MKKIIIIVILAIFLIWISYFIKPDQESDIPVIFKVSNHVGLSIDKDKLHFGSVPKGGKSTKQIFLYNNDSYSKYVKLSLSNNLTDWIILSEKRFVLASNENKTVTLSVNVPKDASLGNYTGNLHLTFWRLY